MKCYVASAYSNHEQVRAFMSRLRADGHTVTVDWTAEGIMKREEDAGLLACWREHKRPTGEALRLAHEVARKDVQGVVNADVFFALYHERMQGGWAELGVALANDTPCVVVAPEGVKLPVFVWHPYVTLVDDEDEAYAVFRGIQAGRQQKLREFGLGDGGTDE